MNYNYYHHDNFPDCNTSYNVMMNPAPYQFYPDLQLPNRFVYVNQNYQPQSTVLINPNFKKTVLINPNFRRTIHVNPNIHKNINNTTSGMVNGSLSNHTIQKEEQTTRSVATNQRIRTETVTAPLVVATRTKLIRGIPKAVEKIQQQPVHTKYKIVRTETEKNITNNAVGQNKYKIDRRKSHDKRKSLENRRIIKSRYKLLNKSFDNGPMKKFNSKFVRISGVLYKKTPNVLRKADISINKVKKNNKLNRSKVLKIGSQIYKLGRDKKTLKVILVKNNDTELDTTKVTLARNAIKKKILLSQLKNKNTNRLKKSNVPCPIYKMFGRCKGNERGTCIRIHNSNQIALCTRFLQGACINKNCLLSHKVQPEKMPTCKYFLENMCSKDDCPYLHVKINPKADICKDFLEGFCRKAQECDKRHQFLCPDFEKTGTCPRRLCQYPHGNKLVRNFKLKAAKKTKPVRSLPKRAVRKIYKRKTEKIEEQNDKNIRYYIDTVGDDKNLTVNVNYEPSEQIHNIDGDVESCDLNFIKKRKVLGELPYFIPFGEK